MDSSSNDLLNRIESNYFKLSKGQKRIADYMLNNYEKVAFMTASVLGDTVGVSESTVVRFANALGYDGYPKLQKGLQESIKTKLTTVQRFEMSKSHQSDSSYLKQIMANDIENIRKTMETFDEDMIQNVVESIHSARKIYILGLRSSSVLANYMGFYLTFIMDSVQVVPTGSNEIIDQIVNIKEEDVLITFSFPRYSKRTIDIVEYAKKKGATVVGITDSNMAPITPHLDYCLTAKYNMNTFIDSLVAPLSLVNALIIAISLNERERVEDTFEELESVWNQFNIYNIK